MGYIRNFEGELQNMTKIICSIFSLDAKIGVNVLKGEILKVTKLEGYTGSIKEVI